MSAYALGFGHFRDMSEISRNEIAGFFVIQDEPIARSGTHTQARTRGGMADDYGDYQPSEEEPEEEEPGEEDFVPDEADAAPPPEWENPMVFEGLTILSKNAETGADPRTTDRYMTKYERARILGVRAEHIALGSPLMVDRGNLTDPMAIAEKELRERKLPLVIHRKLTDQLAEEWDVNELLGREKLLLHARETEVQTGASSAPRGVPVPGQAVQA